MVRSWPRRKAKEKLFKLVTALVFDLPASGKGAGKGQDWSSRGKR